MQRVTAEKMAVSEDDLNQRLQELSQLLPNLASKMTRMGPDNLAKLVADPSQLALKLVQLRAIFPEANTARMVAHRMALILQDNLQGVAASAGNRSTWLQPDNAMSSHVLHRLQPASH